VRAGCALSDIGPPHPGDRLACVARSSRARSPLVRPRRSPAALTRPVHPVGRMEFGVTSPLDRIASSPCAPAAFQPERSCSIKRPISPSPKTHSASTVLSEREVHAPRIGTCTNACLCSRAVTRDTPRVGRKLDVCRRRQWNADWAPDMVRPSPATTRLCLPLVANECNKRRRVTHRPVTRQVNRRMTGVRDVFIDLTVSLPLL
jgi:hypothetical protein